MTSQDSIEFTDRPKPDIVYVSSEEQILKKLKPVRGRVIKDLIDFQSFGFQGSKLYEAYTILRQAIKQNYKIVLGFTSNAISCGVRDLITLLCKHKLVHCVVTTGGGIQEDLFRPNFEFKYADVVNNDGYLREKGINRTQNIYVPNECYVWLQNVLRKLIVPGSPYYDITPSRLAQVLGDQFHNEQSYLYWCSRNNIPVIPGGLEDCAIGDFYGLAYYRCMLSNQRPPTLNSAASLYDYLHFLFNSSEKVCAVILGGGFAKHFVMNGLISRNGADSVIYLNSSPYAEGSNAGAPVEQSISWGKSKANVKGIKVEGDFVFTFSLLASKILQEFCKI